MYIVNITNANITTVIHDEEEKLLSGKISQGINTIDSFIFTILPGNVGFNLLNEFSTLVTVYNINKRKYEFVGRVLYAETTMSEQGLISKTVTCESILAYLCDSWQMYADLQNWTVFGLLQHMIDCHNSQVEEYKQFKLGTVTAKDTNNNLYLGIQRESTWDSIRYKLIEKIGGELQIRIEDDGLYLDYLDKLGESRQTAIELSVNMKSITKEQDPTAFITRLIPLGTKLSEDTETRLSITEVNNGIKWIDDEEAIEVYGVHVGVVEWDDVTIAENLLKKGKEWLENNNKVYVKYSITALDLSLIGLSFEGFEIGNTYPVKNALMGIDDRARVIKKSIDICNVVKSSIEVGDTFKTLSDIQREQALQVKKATQEMQQVEQKIANDFIAVNKKIEDKEVVLNKQIEKTASNLEKQIIDTKTQLENEFNKIKLEVRGSLGSKASIILFVGENEYTGEINLEQIRQAFANDPTAISISSGTVTFNTGTLIVNSNYFKLDKDGYVEMTDAVLSNAYLYENTFLYFCDTKKETKREILGYTSGYVTVGNSNYPTILQGSIVCLQNANVVVADANVKNNMENLQEAYETFLDNLEPIRYQYNIETTGRYHVGYTAQAVKIALEKAGLSLLDFAGYINLEQTGKLGLAYDEFIAILHKKIKRLEQRLVVLEENIAL
mgnify:CR=1 FL=1